MKKKWLIDIIIFEIIYSYKSQGEPVGEQNQAPSQGPQRKSFSIRLSVLVAIIFVFFICVRYTADTAFKKKVDTNVLKKEISESTLKIVELDSDNNPYVYAYSDFVVVLAKNKLTEYSPNGDVVAELDVNISIPIFASSDKYLLLADKDAQNIYLISGSSIIWKNTVDGDISQASVNKNGYSSIIVKNTIHKSVVIYFNPDGQEQFRVISSNYATSSSISPNNKYMAVGEVDYSGTIIKSIIKIVSVELAQKDPDHSIVNTYNSKNNEIVSDINYQNSGAICMFSSYIQKVSPTLDELLYEYTSDDVFVDINSKNHLITINKQSSGLFTYEYGVSIKNTGSNLENLYILNSDLPKSVNVSGNNILLNLGNEVHIINTSGWLLKKYTSSKQVNDIILGEHVAGIVYKNKIDIIGF